jgi:hypothetical protein
MRIVAVCRERVAVNVRAVQQPAETLDGPLRYSITFRNFRETK